MEPASTLLLDLALVLGMAGITTVLCHKLKQPVVLGYLLAGLIVGPYVPIPLFADQARVTALSELGVVLVMFGIGLEFSVRRMLRILPRTGVVAAIQVGTLIWLGYFTGRMLGWDKLESMVVGAALCISSTMIVARVFGERRVDGRLTELVYSVLVIQDFVAVVLIAVLAAIVSGTGAEAGVQGAAVAGTVGKLVGFLVVLVAVGFVVVPRLVRSVAGLGSNETLLVVSVGLCFALGELAAAAGFSVALGAFLAGSLVAESGRGPAVEKLVRPVRDVFAAIFFVTVGMSVDPASLMLQPFAIVALVLVVVVGQLLSVSVGGFLAGFGLRTAIQAGTTLAQVGEFSFIIVGVAVAAGAVGPSLLPSVVAASAITAFLTPWLVRMGEPLAAWVDRKLPHALQTYVRLYATWLENLRSSTHRHSLASVVRHCLLWLALDAAIVGGLLVAAALSERWLANWMHELLAAPRWLVDSLLVLSLLGASTPFVMGIVRLSRQLGVVLSRAALPQPPEGQLDFAAAPRRAYMVTVQLSTVLFVTLPLGAVLQPFVPAGVTATLPLLVLLLLVSLLLSFWKGARNLDEHARAGAEVVAEILARQAGDEPGAHGAHDQDLEQVADMLPGLGRFESVRLAGDSAAVGASLRELDLRGRTGASVVAIGRGGESIVSPPATLPLEAGDVLCLSGSQPALAAGREFLARRVTAAEASDTSA